jgi:hypothetical protein
VLGGNIEGTENEGVRIYGNSGDIKFVSTALQYSIRSVDDCPIRVYGGGNTITLDFSSIGPTVRSLKDGTGNFVKPSYLIKSFGNQNYFTLPRPLKFLNEDYSYLCVNSAGSPNDFYGNVGIPLTPSQSPGFNNSTEYGLLLQKQKPTVVEKLWVGADQNVAAYGVVNVASGLPTISAKPGLYFNAHPTATKSNCLFVKTGDPAAQPTNTGWFAVNVP